MKNLITAVVGLTFALAASFAGAQAISVKPLDVSTVKEVKPIRLHYNKQAGETFAWLDDEGKEWQSDPVPESMVGHMSIHIYFTPK